MIILYTLKNCPNCERIKAKLEVAGYEYQEADMSAPENLTELRFNGCFAMEAPVLNCDGVFFEYCHCSAEGFFAELFGVMPDQQEIPVIDGRMTISDHKVYTGTRFQKEHLR